jgi:hypothetical protein
LKCSRCEQIKVKIKVKGLTLSAELRNGEAICLFFRAGVAADHGSTGASPEVTLKERTSKVQLRMMNEEFAVASGM